MIHENATLQEIITHYESVIERIRRSHRESYEKMVQYGDSYSENLMRLNKAISELADENDRLRAENQRLMCNQQGNPPREVRENKPFWRRLI